jgi:hypothetical protein
VVAAGDDGASDGDSAKAPAAINAEQDRISRKVISRRWGGSGN